VVDTGSCGNTFPVPILLLLVYVAVFLICMGTALWVSFATLRAMVTGKEKARWRLFRRTVLLEVTWEDGKTTTEKLTTIVILFLLLSLMFFPATAHFSIFLWCYGIASWLFSCFVFSFWINRVYTSIEIGPGRWQLTCTSDKNVPAADKAL
jgi:hypothetical protein